MPEQPAPATDQIAPLLEALLFVADGPVEEGALARALGLTRRQIEGPLTVLGDALRERGLRLQRGPQGAQLVTAPAAAVYIEQFLGLESARRLSAAALETLAISPHSYLVTPRVLAAILMFPVVTAVAMAVGVLSGWFTAVNLLDLSSVEFLRGARQFYNFKDIWFGLVKSASFGGVVATMGCFEGLHTRGGAEGVGRATTRAVVLGCQAILVLDAFWALVLL